MTVNMFFFLFLVYEKSVKKYTETILFFFRHIYIKIYISVLEICFKIFKRPTLDLSMGFNVTLKP